MTTPDPERETIHPPGERDRAVAERRGGPRAGLGLGVLAALIAVFLATPLAQYGSHHYSTADFLQQSSLVQNGPEIAPRNSLLSDPPVQMQPWAWFNRDELRAGRIPLWNPYNGGGIPHLANYQSGVFSPFNLPFYVLGFKAALIASAFLKLFALGAFTFLFLGQLRLGLWPALAGATAYAFSGYNVLLLGYPHPGAMLALPAGLYFVELAVRRHRDGGGSLRGPLAGLTLTLAASLLAGHPEPAYFCALLLCAYTLARLFLVWRALGRDRAALSSTARLAGALLFAALLSVALAAPQLLPFFEYLEESKVLVHRTGRQTPLEGQYWPLLVFPDALGNPSAQNNVLGPYELVNLDYVGAVVLLAAAAAPLLAWRDRRVVFFAAASLAWLAYAYDRLGVGELASAIPTLSLAPINRSQGLFGFCAAVCAALTLEHLLRRPAGRGAARWPAAAVLVAAGAAFALFRSGAGALAQEHGVHDVVELPLYVARHVTFIAGGLALGAGAMAGLFALGAPRARAACAALFVAAIFLQGGFLLRDYNTTTEDERFFVRSYDLGRVLHHVGDERIVVMGTDMPPAVNMVYELPVVANYDAMWVRRYDELYLSLFGASDLDNWRMAHKVGERGLQLFGVRYLLARDLWRKEDPFSQRLLVTNEVQKTLVELRAGVELRQVFDASGPGLQGLWIPLLAPAEGDGAVVARIEEADSGEPLGELRLTAADLRDRRDGDLVVDRFSIDGQEASVNMLAFGFAPRPDSAGRTYRLVLSGLDGGEGASPMAITTPLGLDPTARLELDGAPQPTTMPVVPSFDMDRFERIEDLRELELYEYRASPGRFHTVTEALRVRGADASLATVLHPDFDPGSQVVLAGGGDATSAPPAPPSDRVVSPAGEEAVYLVDPVARRLLLVRDLGALAALGLRDVEVEEVTAEEFADHEEVVDTEHMNAAYGFTLARPDAGAAGALGPGGSGEAGPVEIVAEAPDRVLLRAERASPGYLVTTMPHYPGWRALVNGEERPLLRANHAFGAVELGAGTSEVELVYEPGSFRRGVWLALAAAVLGLSAAFLPGLWRRRGARAAGP